MSSERCVWPHCRNTADGVYFGKSVCDYHWEKFLASENPKTAAAARKKIGLPAKLEHVSADTPLPTTAIRPSTRIDTGPDIEDADDDEIDAGAEQAVEVEEAGEETGEDAGEETRPSEVDSLLSRISGGEFDMEI